MAVNQQQVDNLVNMLDGYVEQGGHHLNVNVFTRETLSDKVHTLVKAGQGHARMETWPVFY